LSEVEVWRGGVATWECDTMGHLNVGFYVAKSMEALAGFAAELGMPQAFAPRAQSTLIVREQHIRFLREARPGAPLTITAGVVEMGEVEARLLLLMHHASGELAASFQTVVAHATARDGTPFPWPGRLRARAEALAVEVPPQAAARSIGLDPVETRASLARADELGLKRTGLGVVRSGDCDVFGRMRPELMMARISDAIPHFFDGERPGGSEAARVGGAALEYRLAHFAWPRAGDRVELRSGSAGGDARFRKLVHWLLDPATGRPWGAAEAIAVSFDLETRKIIALSDEALAAVNAEAIEGLTL
jgi:acyl-CoA thioester hydrolase